MTSDKETEGKEIATAIDHELVVDINSELTPQERAINVILENFLDRSVSKDKRDETSLEKVKMFVDQLGADDLVSSMLATQMVSTHDMLLSQFNRASKNPDNPQAVSMMAKLGNLFLSQLSMRERLQGHSQQRVTVEHVHVHDGAQAIVGNVIRGEGQNGAREIAK